MNDRIEWSKAAWKWIADAAESNDPPVNFSDLKIIPTEDSLLSRSDDRPIPYRVRDRQSVSELPDWLSIHALPKSFADWLAAEETTNCVLTELAEKVGIRSFSEEAVVEAFGQALLNGSYDDDLEQKGWDYLDFARSRDWPENPQLENFDWTKVELGCIQIPAITSEGNRSWISARDAYFGSEWGNVDLPLLFSDNMQIHWASSEILARWPKAEFFLQVCGVNHFPKLTSKGVTDAERRTFWSRVKSQISGNHRRVYDNPEGSCESRRKLRRFSSLTVGALNLEQASALLRLVLRGWATRYSVLASQKVTYSYYRCSYEATASDVWLQQLKDSLTVSALRGLLTESGKLGKLWIRGAETPDWAWYLFPKLDASRIGSGDDFSKWIRECRLVRLNPEDIPHEEWLYEFFPALEKRFTRSDGESDQDLATAASYLYRGFIESRVQNLIAGWKPPRACWKGDLLSIAGPDESVWAVASERELHRWRQLLPVFVFRRLELQSANFKSLGYRQLEDELTITLQGDDSRPDAQYTHWLQNFIAWIYAIRRNEVSERPPLASWQKVAIIQKQEVRVQLSVNGQSLEEIVPYHFDKLTHTIVVSGHDWQFPQIKASAIVEALDLPDVLTARIEILIGLNEESRRDRLLGEGFIESDLRGWLNEYLGNEELPPPVSEENGKREKPAPVPAGVPAVPNSPDATHSKPTAESAPVSLHGPETEPVFASPHPQTSPTPPHSYQTVWPSNVPGVGGTRQPPQDALDVENRSREIVERKLLEWGWSVTQMKQENKGFDLQAERNGVILLVEVKGNKDQASRIDLTVSELEVADKAGSSYRWQLWHVSHLAERSGDQPEIRVYDSIPPAALSATGYQLDLSACKQVGSPDPESRANADDPRVHEPPIS